MSPSTVSIIIPFYERLTHLTRCLNSLSFSQNDFDEVIVTDDGSSDEVVAGLKKIIASFDFPIRHVWQPHQGFRVAAARNNGVRAANGSYLLFFDCDFLILPGTVRAHLNRARKGRFVAGNCKYLSRQQSETLSASQLTPPRLAELYAAESSAELWKDHFRYIRRTLRIRLGLAPAEKQCLGGHFSIHREDFERVNGYDENFVGWGGEDEDLGIRLVKAGIHCCSALPYAKVLHVWHPKELGNKHWQTGPNMAYFQENRPWRCANGLIKD